jgi:hypothetical protein
MGSTPEENWSFSNKEIPSLQPSSLHITYFQIKGTGTRKIRGIREHLQPQVFFGHLYVVSIYSGI